jgi:hypothetical protein
MRYLFLIILFFFAIDSRATHVMGGEITWTCQGGSYVFELVFYRDCNGADINTSAETIQVWNHATINSFPVNFVSRTDISPICNSVTGAPPQLTCGGGAMTGNGIGAIEKVIYQSAPIDLGGAPPATGWIFTAQNFSRSGAITNLVNPSNYGITISAYMFSSASTATGCVDSSPRFLQEPYLVTCAGSPYVYNMNAVDPDLDSIAVSFGAPLNNFTSGTFNPPMNPIEVPYEVGFSVNSPTPDNTFDVGNVSTQVNLATGELTFTSNTIGNFVVKVIVKSYRNGALIAQVEREIQLVVINCLDANTAPVIPGPFAGLYETTITAGDFINFNLVSSDFEFLQDGTPQNNLLTASGLMFGTNFTSSTGGCGILPCATLDATPTIYGVQAVSTDFNWQTSCDHLVNQYGIVAEEVPYQFVFKVQDDFCQVPRVTYATITIHVQNPGIIQAPKIECIQTAANGNVTINWTPVSDPNGTFVSYILRRVASTNPLATITNINTSSYTVSGITSVESFYLEVVSGCNGNTIKSSDTVSNIYMTLLNPSDGTVVLQWNDPITPYNSSLNPYYHILREYPTGVWTVVDSVAYGTTIFKDTIDICQAFLNYQIELPTTSCSFTSTIAGDNFEDMITPDIPTISSVTIDTLTGDLTIFWNQNNQSDTYGYVIYMADPDGVLFELDTVFGIGNTSYSFHPNTSNGALSFSVAAFDSCFTASIPPTYQTSAKGNLSTTVFVSYTYNVCGQIARLNWTNYVGWDDFFTFEIYGRINGGAWTLYGTTTDIFYELSMSGSQQYEFVIRAKSNSGNESFSNKIIVTSIAPSEPAFNYTRVATVDTDHITIKHEIELVGGVKEISLEKKNEMGVFESIQQIPATTSFNQFTDYEVDPDRYTYTYRVRIIDSCGNLGAVGNEVTTVLLKIQSDDIRLKNYLTWSPYIGFNGSIIEYNIYRSIDGVQQWTPIAVLPSTSLSYEDDLYDVSNLQGKVCYHVEAVESMNIYSYSEVSNSNEICHVFDPLIYIPNAFTPGGLNPIFKPVVSLMNPNAYKLTIIDRWGDPIFVTTDINEGWNGRLADNNKLAEVGVYMYVLELKDGDGEEIRKRGHVSLIR